MTLMYFLSPRIGGGVETPTIFKAIKGLRLSWVDEDGVTHHNVKSYRTSLRANVQATNKAIVAVDADDDVITELALTYELAGHPTKTNPDGSDHADKIKFNGHVATEDSSERERLQHEKDNLKGVKKQIKEYASDEVRLTALIAGMATDIIEQKGLEALAIIERDKFNTKSDEYKDQDDIVNELSQGIKDKERLKDKAQKQLDRQEKAVHGAVEEGQTLEERETELIAKIGAY